uniref:Uncharacterized protein n=1 Tax=Moniliophthora roreri TaxID=221103 RepID=A0A0W0G5I9_MONRR
MDMQLMSAFSSFMVFYTSIIFTIVSVIFFAHFTLALLKTITVLLFSTGYPKQRLLSKIWAFRRQLPVPIRGWPLPAPTLSTFIPLSIVASPSFPEAAPTAPQAVLLPESTYTS